MLDTVKCPKEFEPLFAKAQEYVGKYFSQSVQDPTKGTIEIFGQRYILVRAASMSIDFFETVTNLYKDFGPEKAVNVARSLLFDIAHAIGKMDARNFHKKMRLEDPIEKLSAGPVHFSHSGWAFVDIFPESRPSPDEDYYLIYDHPFSFESDAWIKAGKKAHFPVCVMNAGYSSGWCEESFGVTLVAQEILCKAKGDEVCRFIMAHPSKIDGYVQEYLNENPQFIKERPEYKIPGFFEKKVVEEKLKESEEKYRRLFEEALDAIFLADVETGTLIDCNETAAQLVERERSEIIGRHQSILHPPEDIEGQFSETFRRHLNAERGQLLETRVITKDGRMKDVAIKANMLEIGGKRVLQGIFRDVTEQKRAEEKIKRQQKNLEAIFEVTPVGMLLVDENMVIKKANNVLGKLVGRDVAAIVNKQPGNGLGCIRSNDHPRGCGHGPVCQRCPIRKALGSVLTTDQAVHKAEIEASFTVRDRKVGLWLEVSAEPLKIDGAKCAIVAINNITERKQAEEGFKRSKKEAETANASKSEFLANMSHEIRTPLNAIIGFGDVLADGNLSDEQKGYVDTIRSSGKHLVVLINDILDFSKIEAGKLEVETIDCSVRKIFAVVESMMRPAATEKGLEFAVQENAELPAVIRSDPARLQQCLINLANNAIKFTEEGHVYVKVSLENKDDKPFIRFDVEDTGIGIALDQQGVIFESFTQADGSTNRKFGGAGLGLAITKRLAELLGGSLTLVSEPGVGSVFTLTVPAGVDVHSGPTLEQCDKEVMAGEKQQLQEQRYTGRILVAKDVPTNQMLVRLLLEKMGFEVIIAGDGAEAVARALDETFEMILMDIQMPNMNGYEATRALRKEGITTPIVALTANAMKGDDKKCLEAGCDDYLAKPIDRKDLCEVISKYLVPSQSLGRY